MRPNLLKRKTHIQTKEGIKVKAKKVGGMHTARKETPYTVL